MLASATMRAAVSPASPAPTITTSDDRVTRQSEGGLVADASPLPHPAANSGPTPDESATPVPPLVRSLTNSRRCIGTSPNRESPRRRKLVRRGGGYEVLRSGCKGLEKPRRPAA